jgi:hypothetical protein
MNEISETSEVTSEVKSEPGCDDQKKQKKIDQMKLARQRKQEKQQEREALMQRVKELEQQKESEIKSEPPQVKSERKKPESSDDDSENDEPPQKKTRITRPSTLPVDELPSFKNEICKTVLIGGLSLVSLYVAQFFNAKKSTREVNTSTLPIQEPQTTKPVANGLPVFEQRRPLGQSGFYV